ncbi:Kae1-like domain-containing protein [Sphingomonas abietis]|uniref:Carbamoyltransferase HypF n=1 Tax=Sphingomonas abietis TaxID=3012344 RepID=A0ABY7NS60_9SPHN|nr:carbamoyltransferase HypF [Sphingomonas abietis]WBO24399.1 carbamoyltransferase HypF [Sphingomonas abietis]
MPRAARIEGDAQPLVLPLPKRFPVVLGLGAFLKNTTTLIDGDQAYVSRDAGHTDSVGSIVAMGDRMERFLEQASGPPAAIAHDLHPDFPSTRLALRLASERGIPALPVQHHHAHVAAVAAEHGVTGALLGLAFDGFGLGPAREAWGGELLLCGRGDCRRLGALVPLSQPGGDIAAREPWRMGAAALQAVGRSGDIASRWPDRPAAKHLSAIMRRELNSPPTSSAGRLFDAACGLLDVHPVAAFEGQAPMALEALVAAPEVLPGGWRITDGQLDFRPLLAVLADLGDPARGADLFHGTLAAGVADWVVRHVDEMVLPPLEIAFSGGCFYNRVFSADLADRLGEAGLRVLRPERLGPGDAAISLGQAYVAALSL